MSFPVFANQGPRLISGDPDELVVNGTFDTDLSGWTNPGSVIFTWQAANGGQAFVDRNSQGQGDYPYQDILVNGVSYDISFDVIECDALATVTMFVGVTNATYQVKSPGLGYIGTVSGTMVSGGTIMSIGPSDQLDATCVIDNVSVKATP